MKYMVASALAVLCLVGVTGCTAQPGGDHADTQAHDEEAPVLLMVDDPLAGTASLTEIADASDLVVIARATDTETGVQVGDKLPPYSLVTLEVQEVVRGGASASIKVLMRTQTEDGRELVTEGQPDISSDASVWMLKTIDPMFNRPGDEYVLSSTSGLIPGDGGGSVDLRLKDLSLSQKEAQELGTITKIAQFLEQ